MFHRLNLFRSLGLQRGLFAKCFIAAFLFMQTASAALGSKGVELKEHARSQPQTFVVSLEDLHFDQGRILMNVNGRFYQVLSLRKDGHQWFAEAAVGKTCPWGHPLCGHCELCHHRICPVYQSRCSRSK